MTYPDNNIINSIIEKYKSTTPEYHFTTKNGKIHTLWLIDENEDIKTIKGAFKNIKSLYIADGHHRTASSYLLSKENKSKESSCFLSYLLSESNLKIASFNRLIKTLNNLSEAEFIQKLTKKFEVIPLSETIYEPKKAHEFSMYLGNKTYKLKLKQEKYNFKSSLHHLDTHILYKSILKKILDINNVRTDKRITYVSEYKGQEYLKNKVANGEFKVAFGLYPVSVKQMKEISDDGLTMPPKSTYILPKLKSGLLIYEF